MTSETLLRFWTSRTYTAHSPSNPDPGYGRSRSTGHPGYRNLLARPGGPETCDGMAWSLLKRYVKLNEKKDKGNVRYDKIREVEEAFGEVEGRRFSKCIGELNIVEINRELHKRGIDTEGSKVIDESSAQVPEGKTLEFGREKEALSEEDEVNSEKSLINQFMEQMLDRLEGLETTVDKQQLTIGTLSESVERLERELAGKKLRSTEQVEQASCSCRGNSPQPSASDVSGANQICPDKSQNLPDKTQALSGGSGVLGDLFGVSGEVSGRSHGEALRSSFSGVKRVYFPDSLLIPQNKLNMARASIPEFAGKREEDPVLFLFQAEAILEETAIHVARWVTVLAPQLKVQAGTWWGTMRAFDLPWQNLQSELLNTAQTKTKTLGKYVLYKYQLYRRLNLGLTEEAVVMTVIGLIRDEFRIHARIQRLKAFSELRALAHVLDGSKAVMSGVSTNVPPKLKWLDKRKTETVEKSQMPNLKQRLSSGAGCRACGSHDHSQAACPKRMSESGNAKTTHNVPVQEPQIIRTDMKKRNFEALRTEDSGKSPKKSDQTSFEPAKPGNNGIPPEKYFSHPKITSGVRSCPVKTVELPEKNRRNRQSHPRKSIGSDVPVKEPQFVSMDRVNGGATERFIHRDNKSGKSARVENIPDKCENLTEVSYFSKENFADSISSDAEQDEDSGTNSKFELRKRFSDLRTGVLKSPAIATVSKRKTKITDVPLSAIELVFALWVVVALLDSQAARTCVKPSVTKKFGRSFTEEPEIVRMLDDLIGDVFLGHVFLVEQQIAWDYSGCIIHLGKESRVSVSWRNPVTPVTLGVDLATAGLPEGEYGMRVKEVLCQYLAVFSGEVGRTWVIVHQISLKDTNPVAQNAYGVLLKLYISMGCTGGTREEKGWFT
ncbi:hypothetical protein QTP88_006757 [Uroleucon formosanum]